jgi:hypothetical protein
VSDPVTGMGTVQFNRVGDYARAPTRCWSTRSSGSSTTSRSPSAPARAAEHAGDPLARGPGAGRATTPSPTGGRRTAAPPRCSRSPSARPTARASTRCASAWRGRSSTSSATAPSPRGRSASSGAPGGRRAARVQRRAVAGLARRSAPRPTASPTSPRGRWRRRARPTARSRGAPRASPAASTGCTSRRPSRGAWGFIEPYAALDILAEFPLRSTTFRYFDTPYGQLASFPPITSSLVVGAEIIPWENRETWQRHAIDLRLRGTYRSQGRDYSPLYDALGSSTSRALALPGCPSNVRNADGTCQPGARCTSTGSPPTRRT